MNESMNETTPKNGQPTHPAFLELVDADIATAEAELTQIQQEGAQVVNEINLKQKRVSELELLAQQRAGSLTALKRLRAQIAPEDTANKN